MAEQVFTIPLSNVPQKFNIDLAGRELTFVSMWNSFMNVWVIDIYDAITEEKLIGSLPLITGADLLEQHEYIGIEGQLIVSTDGDELTPPTLDNLGVEAQLYYIVDVDE